MVSSLAAQLAQGSSLNATLLHPDRSRRAPTQSYLFTGRDADAHDLDSIHALASNALAQLARVDAHIGVLGRELFDDSAKGWDRTLRTKKENKEMDARVDKFLAALGPWLLEAQAGRALEWLVRRFRVNEFNVEAVLTLFLPYHESPHFAKMVTILHIKDHPTWRFLGLYAKAGKPLPRAALVGAMLDTPDLARFVAALYEKSARWHRTAIAFGAGTLLEYVARAEKLDAGVMAFLLPAILAPLKGTREGILASYVLLAALSQKCRLTPPALRTILTSMVGAAKEVSPKQCVNAAVAVCAPQEPLDMLQLEEMDSALAETLVAAFSLKGADKLVLPLINGCLAEPESALDTSTVAFLECVITSPDVPVAVLDRVARLLIQRLLDQDAAEERRLLTLLHQRCPRAVAKARAAVVEEAEEAEYEEEVTRIKELLDQMAVTLATPLVQGRGTSTDMVLASTSADTAARVVAVQKLLDIIESPPAELDLAELDPVKSALATRALDAEPGVLDALYSRPAVLRPVLVADPAFLTTLAAHLAGTTLPRQAVRAHLGFLAPLAPTDALLAVFWPCLLPSKARQKSAAAAWKIVREHPGGIGGHALLRGVEGEDGDALAIVRRVAANAEAGDRAAHLEFLAEQMGGQNPSAYGRTLAYLVVHALLPRLSGEHQVQAASKVLDAMGLDSLEGMGEMAGAAGDVQVVLSEASVSAAVISKPASHNTIRRMQASLLLIVAGIKRPENAKVEWLESKHNADDRGARYVVMVRRVYALTNSSNAAHALSAHIIRTLFITLGSDALVFLCGVSLAASPDPALRAAGLRHAAAFISAQKDAVRPLDFQAVLPCLLAALQREEAETRRAALECVNVMRELAVAKQAADVYAMDSIYGDCEKLQYLEWEDLQRYLHALVESRDHVAGDPGYLQVLHQEHLGKSKSDSKKDAGYKQRILCYLLSHVISCDIPSLQVAILQSLRHVSNAVKARMLSDVVQRLCDTDEATLSTLEHMPEDEQFIALCISSFDTSSVKDLNEASSTQWTAFNTALRWSLGPAFQSYPSSSAVLATSLPSLVSAGLNRDRRVEMCSALLQIGSLESPKREYCTGLLTRILDDIPTIILLLTLHRPVYGDEAARTSKRQKLDAPSADGGLSVLTLLAEVLNGKAQDLSSSFDLIASLLETLASVVNADTSIQSEANYALQVLLSVLDDIASRLALLPNIEPSPLQATILVDIIRGTDNPQTFHQALLVVATLARLAPEAVIQNVMPIFIFMGSNVFHRDDPYSFRVIQKTIDNVVPVLTATLKFKHDDRLDLWLAVKPFLQPFTDASNHIPRHRRIGFYVHLVDVLDPREFLAPVAMLLVDKVANRVVKQNKDEAKATLAIPLALFIRQPPSTQLEVILDILVEADKAVLLSLDLEPTQPLYLQPTRATTDDDHSTYVSQMKRKAQSLIVFVGEVFAQVPDAFALEASGSKVMSDVVSRLLRIAITTPTTTPSVASPVADVCRAARLCLEQALRKMSATSFAQAALDMLKSDDAQITLGALQLLVERLVEISESARRALSATVTQIVDAALAIVSAAPNPALVLAALAALKTVSVTSCTGEEEALLRTIPLLLRTMGDVTYAPASVSVLPSLCAKLGPRTIPHFRAIVQESVALLRRSFDGSFEPTVVGECLDILKELAFVIPSFWANDEVVLVLSLYMDSAASQGANLQGLDGLVKTLTKRLPPALLIPTLCGMWPAEGISNAGRFTAYFVCMKRALRAANRQAVSDGLRSLFKVFLAAFEYRQQISTTTVDEAEAHAIEAFIELTVKLNDTTFKPLFRRLYDWSFTGTAGPARQITFCRVFAALLDYFKSLMTSYMSLLLQPFTEKLSAYSRSSEDDVKLWSCIIDVLTKSLLVDEGAFWQDSKLRTIATPLIEQISFCISANIAAEGRVGLPACLSALVEVAVDDALLKSINLKILMHTRAEDARLRMFALLCAQAIWAAHGGKLLGVATETATFIAECAEDESDNVVKAALDLKNVVEGVAGSIQL